MYNQRAVMADIYENRRERLRQLIEERFARNQTAFAKAFGFHRSSINEYFRGSKNIGDQTADRIERAAELPTGWLDEHDPRKKPVTREPLRGPPRKVHSLKELLSAGYSQREIAERLGVHESTVSKALKRERERPQHAAAPQG